MHPELLKLTVQACREYIDAGDCHGAPPPIERLIDAVVQLTDSPAGYKLVPLSPTAAMVDAGLAEHDTSAAPEDEMAGAYRAMVAAAAGMEGTPK